MNRRGPGGTWPRWPRRPRTPTARATLTDSKPCCELAPSPATRRPHRGARYSTASWARLHGRLDNLPVLSNIASGKRPAQSFIRHGPQALVAHSGGGAWLIHETAQRAAVLVRAAAGHHPRRRHAHISG